MLEPKRITRGRPGAEGTEVTRPPSDVIRLRVVLLDVAPPVWRRLEVPAHWTLRQLHAALECVLGWTGGETHRFRVGDRLYGMTSDRAKPRDSRWVTLAEVAALGSGAFGYDLVGEETWRHDIRIELLAEGHAENQRAVCLDGERAWPPESAPDADEARDGVHFLPSETADAYGGFDIEAINRALSRLG
jgi:hypothetical protein